jgi:hypothetical protein
MMALAEPRGADGSIAPGWKLRMIGEGVWGEIRPYSAGRSRGREEWGFEATNAPMHEALGYTSSSSARRREKCASSKRKAGEAGVLVLAGRTRAGNAVMTV